MAHIITHVDRSIVRCSVTKANFSYFSTALTFLWLLSLRQGKESNKQAITQYDLFKAEGTIGA